MAASRGSSTLLALVECGVRTCGAANDKKWCTLKTSKRIRKLSCETGGGITVGQSCAMQEFTSSHGELVTETTEGHRVFATPPCPGLRRLAIVVAATLTKCMVNSSFRVRGRNCSIDVCWERKKFRVVCSHMHLGSVEHLYARDLEDLSMLTMSREKDSHVHICVDVQMGLGAGDTQSLLLQYWHCHNHYTSGRKTETSLSACLIMEHSLIATNTFSTNDASYINIFTRNFNGCHEPQQIDYILSSDRSLRSRTFDSSATASDQWGLTPTIRERHGKALGKRHVRKPIGWECNNHIAFNITVRTQLNWSSGLFGQELRLDGDSQP